jgi:hypothetical protein
VRGRGAVHCRPDHAIDISEANRTRPLTLNQCLRGADGPTQCEDRSFLVQVQFREPPETLAAVGEPLAERAPVDTGVPQRLDPGVCLRGRLLFALCIEVIRKADAPMSVVDLEDGVERHQSPRAIASSAAR